MPKHNIRSVERIKVEKPADLPPVPTVKMRVLIDANVKITGISGRTYSFNGAGSVQDVEETDVQSLLERRQGRRQCCGGEATGNVVFELVGE